MLAGVTLCSQGGLEPVPREKKDLVKKLQCKPEGFVILGLNNVS